MPDEVKLALIDLQKFIATPTQFNTNLISDWY